MTTFYLHGHVSGVYIKKSLLFILIEYISKN